MAPLSRRSFFKTGALAAALPLGVRAAPAAAATPRRGGPTAVSLSWLEGAPALMRRHHLRRALAARRLAQGPGVRPCPAPAASSPARAGRLAYWPDGSLKWTAHALPAQATGARTPAAAPGHARAPATQLRSTNGRGRDRRRTPASSNASVPRQGARSCAASAAAAARSHAPASWWPCDDQPDGSAGTTRQTAFDSELTRSPWSRTARCAACSRSKAATAPRTAPAPGCRSSSACTFMQAPNRCASCTPSSSTATSRRTSCAASACASTCRCPTKRTTATCASAARTAACGPKACATSPACGATRAPPCARRSWPGWRCRPIRRRVART
jgi:hypothetical protein